MNLSTIGMKLEVFKSRKEMDSNLKLDPEIIISFKKILKGYGEINQDSMEEIELFNLVFISLVSGNTEIIEALVEFSNKESKSINRVITKLKERTTKAGSILNSAITKFKNVNLNDISSVQTTVITTDVSNYDKKFKEAIKYEEKTIDVNPYEKTME